LYLKSRNVAPEPDSLSLLEDKDEKVELEENIKEDAEGDVQIGSTD
jgi:hypothetical protein